MQKEAFLSHPVFEKIDQLQQIINDSEKSEIIDIENLTFFETFYYYSKEKLSLTIPVLVQLGELNALASEIDAGNVQINTFIGNKNIGHLTNAVNNFNSALNRIRNLPFPTSKGDFNFSKQVAEFQKTVQKKYEEVNSKNAELQKELSELQDELTDKKTQLQTLEGKVVAKETEIQNLLIKYNSEFDALKTTANNSVEIDRTSFSNKIEADRKEYSNTFEEDKSKYESEFNGLVKKLNEGTTAIIGKLNEKLEEAKSIVNIVGNVGVTGNYQNIANQNKSTANFWRWVAIFFMLLMTGLIIWSIIDLSSQEFNIYKSIVRIIAAAALTYPAIYAARESSRHRNLEIKNRNLELELASIGPFIEILPEEKKQFIKEEMVKRYFGNGNLNGLEKNNEHEDISLSGLEKLLKSLVPLIKK